MPDAAKRPAPGPAVDDTDAAAVWVVDDDRAVRFVLATALREAGYEVTAFEAARAVLDALESRRPPALLFTDVRMPGDDGLVLLDAIKARHPQLPVIVMSAYTDIASTAGAFRGGAHEFLSNPFDLDAAVALAAQVLAPLQGRARARDDGAAPPAASRVAASVTTRPHPSTADGCSSSQAAQSSRCFSASDT